MDTREPNSKRYWRLNSLAGLQTQFPLPSPADPEEKERQDALRTEYRQLQQREAAVRARHTRMTSPRL